MLLQPHRQKLAWCSVQFLLDYRTAMGATRVGYLVDLGRTPDDYAHPVANLCQLSGSAAIRLRRADASAGCRFRHLRLR